MDVDATSPAANATSALTGTRKGIADNFDTFLQLLTTQLRNQNPLDPLDTNQFTQQLVQFSGIEQQLKTNEYLAALVAANTEKATPQPAAMRADVVNYIGKVVTTSGTKSSLVDGKASWAFALEEDALVTATIRDSAGKVVHTGTESVPKGSRTYNWDGRTSNGEIAPEGQYTIDYSAINRSGVGATVSTSLRGVVNAVDLRGSEPVLLINTRRVPLSSVTEVAAGA